MKLLILGAGKIGRGFLAQLFSSAGWSLVFVDQSQGIVEELNESSSYPVYLAGSKGDTARFEVKGYRALHTSQTEMIHEELQSSDLAAMAVPAADLDSAVKILYPGLLQRLSNPHPFNLLFCVNKAGAAGKIRDLFLKSAGDEGVKDQRLQEINSRLGIVDTIVIRMAPQTPPELLEKNSLAVLTNDYPELFLNRKAFMGHLPDVPGLTAVERFHAQEVRKLYTYNTVHALLGFLGLAEGYSTVMDCLKDPWVRTAAEEALNESSAGLMGEYGFTEEQTSRWNKRLMEDMENPYLGDQLKRLILKPEEKLGRNERLTGPALLALKHGRKPEFLCRAMAAALSSVNAGADGAKVLCGLTEQDHDLVEEITQACNWLEKEQRASELGFQYEKKYKGCGQCAFLAIQDTLGQREKQVFQALSIFAGGYGLYGGVICSSLIGAATAIGLVSGRRFEHFDGDKEAKYRGFSLAEQLRQRFLWKYGNLVCHRVQEKIMGSSFDLRIPAERDKFEQAGAHRDKCTGVVSDVARWTVRLISSIK